MWTACEWRMTVADVARDVLTRTGLPFPPVDAVAVAHALQMTVAWDTAQPSRGRVKRIRGQSAVFVRPESRPERLQWTVAHELGESLMSRLCTALDLAGEDLSPRHREDLANQFARELLLPAESFRRDCAALHYSLPHLKARYQTASHELIAWRWLDLEQPGIVSLFDQGTLTRRQSNGPARSPTLTPFERDCWVTLRRTRQPVEQSDSRFLVRGWCVDSPGWEREILYTLCRHDSEETSM